MQKNLTIPRFLAISMLALALPLSAFAAEGEDRPEGCPKHHTHRHEMQYDAGLNELHGFDLSAAQVAQLAKLREEQSKTLAENARHLHERQHALNDLVMSESYTPDAAREIIAQIGAVQSEMAKLRAEQSHKVYELLTPAQRAWMRQHGVMVPGMAGFGCMLR